MQIKEASASVLEPYLGASPFPNHGERVVAGQGMMQAASDILLGWSAIGGRDYYVLQLRGMKFSAALRTITLAGLNVFVQVCARPLRCPHVPTKHPPPTSTPH